MSPLDHLWASLKAARIWSLLKATRWNRLSCAAPVLAKVPTASAVLGDVMDIARGLNIPTFGQSATSLRPVTGVRATKPAPYYLRMVLLDKPGALAKVASVLGDAGISIDRMRQVSHDQKLAPVLIVTHKCTRDALDTALDGAGENRRC